MENDQYNYGRGSSDSMSNGTSLAPLEKISMYAETEGSFPKKEDVAIVGRTSEDVILKDGEIDIRCGIRQKPTSNENPNIKGHVLYNNTDPSYIQLKYEPNLCGKKYGNNDKGTNSVVNIVSDKINLISYSDPNQFNLTDKEKLISKEELLRILDNMHPAAYADELITILKVIINAVYTHVHPYPGMSPCNTSEIQQMTNLDLNKVKSDFVRIS